MGQNTRPEFPGVHVPLPHARIEIALGSGSPASVDPATWRWDLSNLYARDIAWGLSNICRFTGQSKRYYSVAEHCVIGYQMSGDPWWLFHDAAECLGFGDVNSRLKDHLFMDVYRMAEKETLHQIAARFDVQMTDVSPLDKSLGNYEARTLTGITVPYDDYAGLPYQPTLCCWSPEYARKEWMRCFDSLPLTKKELRCLIN